MSERGKNDQKGRFVKVRFIQYEEVDDTMEECWKVLSSFQLGREIHDVLLFSLCKVSTSKKTLRNTNNGSVDGNVAMTVYLLHYYFLTIFPPSFMKGMIDQRPENLFNAIVEEVLVLKCVWIMMRGDSNFQWNFCVYLWRWTKITNCY